MRTQAYAHAAAVALVGSLLAIGAGVWVAPDVPLDGASGGSSLAESVPISYPTQRTFVHGTDAAPLPDTAYPGELPVVEQRFVGAIGAQEPDLDFAADGTALYFSWMTETAGPANYKNDNTVLRTTDGGQTWQDVTPTYLSDIDQAGDPVVYRDPLSGRVFLVGHHDYAPILWTDDAGDTWTVGPPVIAAGITDYPKLWSVPAGELPTVNYPSALFLCYFSALQQECRRSLDGGLTWGFVASPFLPTTTANFRCGWTDGRPTGSATDATLYMPYILQREAMDLDGYADCQDPLGTSWGPLDVWVSVSHDHGMTWDLHPVAYSYGDDVLAAADTSMRVATDEAGNAYLLFIDGDAQPVLSTSQDQGRTWSEPVNVAAPGVTAAKLPSIAAGDEGRISFLYVATTVPGGFDAAPEEMAEATWHGYAAFSLNTLDEAPVFATTLTSEPTDPLRRGPCDGRCVLDPNDCAIDCSVGTPVAGMFDYTNTKLDPVTGAAWQALVDMCVGPCAAPGADAFATTTLRAAVGVQTGGTPVVGRPAAPPASGPWGPAAILTQE